MLPLQHRVLKLVVVFAIPKALFALQRQPDANSSALDTGGVVNVNGKLNPDANSTRNASFVVNASSGLNVSGLPLKEGVPPLGSLARPRVYLYEVPEQYHEGMVARYLPGERVLEDDGAAKPPRPSPKDLGVAVAWMNSEVGLQRCFARAPERARTPEEADFFYVPFYPAFCHAAAFAPSLFEAPEEIGSSCATLSAVLTEVVRPGAPPLVGRASRLPRTLAAALAKVGLSRMPELWARAGGRDHIFPAWLSSYTPYLREDYLAEARGPIRLLADFSVIKEPYEGVQDSDYMRTLGYGQSRDLLFPWHFWRAPEDVVAPAEDAARPRFMYLATSTKTLIAQANTMRTTLAAIVQAQPDSLLVDMDTRSAPADFQERMGESVFCPAPPGDTQLATRHYDAILAGCIPVVLTDGRVPLPFDNVLDWSKFSIRMNVSSVEDGSFIEVLRGKTPTEVRELRRNVYAVRPYFMVSPNCSASPSGFDLILHQLAMQAKIEPLLNARPGLAAAVNANATGASVTPLGRALRSAFSEWTRSPLAAWSRRLDALASHGR